MDDLRLFVGVPVRPQLATAIHAAVAQLSRSAPPWRWVVPENYHITLKFLGATSATDVPGIEDALRHVCRDTSAFEVCFRTLGGFPRLRSPRALFYDVAEGGESLTALAAAVDASLHAAVGSPLERKSFHPHLTLARVKHRPTPDWIRILGSAPPLGDARQTVAAVHLMSSVRTPQGAVYQTVKEFALKKYK